MKRAITADNVRTARREGQAEISVPSGTLVTPLARDDARELGIRFVFEAVLPEKGMKSPAPHLENSFSSELSAISPERLPGVIPGQITLHAGMSLEKTHGRSFLGSVEKKQGSDTPDKKNGCVTDCRPGVVMIFLTEDDIRQRSIVKEGEIVLGATEKLTPSAREYIREHRLNVVVADQAGKQCDDVLIESELGVKIPEAGLTHLDASTMVAKTHPRIEARGKLDNLLAEIVLTQALFDPKEKLPPLLKGCLADIKEWVFQTLAAEISGSILPVQNMAGMAPDVLRTVSRNPRHYLNMEHLTPDMALGLNIAILNRLRTLVRETELVVGKAALCRNDIQESLNKLSSAVYVLMLLTRLVESGGKLPDTVFDKIK